MGESPESFSALQWFTYVSHHTIIVYAVSVRRRTLILLSLLMSVLAITQYEALAQWGAVALTIVNLAYSVVALLDTKYPVLGALWVRVFFLSTSVVLSSVIEYGVRGYSVFSANTLAVAASITSVVVIMVPTFIQQKLFTIGSGVFWLLYQIIVGAVGNIPGEIVYIVGACLVLGVAIYQHKRYQVPYEETPSLPTLIRSLMRRHRKQGNTQFITPHCGA